MSHRGQNAEVGSVQKWDGAAWVASHFVGVGTAILSFGGGDTNNATVVISGLPYVSASSEITVSIDGDGSTAEHNQTEHQMVAASLGLCVGNIVPGVGFTVFGTSLALISGDFSVRWSVVG